MKLKFPKPARTKEIINFFKSKKLNNLVVQSEIKSKSKPNLKKITKPYKPELQDLYMLYKYVILNKRTTILEFGSGWSSLVFAKALNELKAKYSKKITSLRRKNPFELFILENEKKYLNISKKRIEKYFLKKKLKPTKVHYNYSDVYMSEYQGKIVTKYKKIPLCNPDFIYLDGPDQSKIKGNISGINIKHTDLMPMVCDILKIEYFLLPGTIIVIDGRGANAFFLKQNFKRKWNYIYKKKLDQHLFILTDDPIGELNKKQLDFYSSN